MAEKSAPKGTGHGTVGPSKLGHNDPYCHGGQKDGTKGGKKY